MPTEEYMQSVCGKIAFYFNFFLANHVTGLSFFFAGSCNFIEFISNSKSGQFFFYSHDGKRMLVQCLAFIV